ncbi:hypothetical protein SAMN04487846_0623 [Microbacterium sp. cf046]|uniref:hypothetical protein n=1 Tax=Microbacterium sp. cf046 TaxID=1761803 RepID=UPI0008F35383|nr:hypothetical protein [Microbacterium sp. cf046]SFR92274.1 hypothetical protein SAMN04487846_0623 [Microbacterium sp. cf046]
MSAYASSVFASPGAQAEHYLIGTGRLTDLLGRVLGERVRRLRRAGIAHTHESVAILREAARAREIQWVGAERKRLLVGRPAL